MKPHIKLKLDGTVCHCIESVRLTQFKLARVDPRPGSIPSRFPMKWFRRMSTDLSSTTYRRIVLAYGSQQSFAKATGFTSQDIYSALKGFPHRPLTRISAARSLLAPFLVLEGVPE